jgi:hypothetical protein
VRGRRTVPLVAALLAIGLAIVPPTAGPALAAEPLRLAVDATYTVQPDEARVRVTLEVTARNLRAPSATTIFYYSEIVLGIQREAAHVRASDTAGDLDVAVRRRPDYTSVNVSLRSRLLYDETARFEIAYDLPGGAPRSDSPIRVGGAFATFGVWAWGDAGRSSVEVRLPPGFESDVLGDALEVEKNDAGWRLRADPADPYAFYAIVDAENAAAYSRTRISLDGGVELVVLAWPEDGRWQDTVATTLEEGLPRLRDLIGLDWPVRHDLQVRERYTPALEGYAGVFYVDESIDVSEDLDPVIIVHEASHAWFNEDLFTGRWISEGLAQEYAWRVITATGGDAAGPIRPSPDDPAAVALTEWSHPGVIRDQETDDYERYGYAAAWWVIHEIVATVGEERMRYAFDSARRNTTAYLGAGPPEQHLDPDGFARLYDLVEDVTAPPSARIDAAFRAFVMTPAQTALLDGRTAARAAYRELLDAGAGWLPGWYVRRPMDAWQFSLATGRIAEASRVLELRDEVAAAAGALDLVPDGTLRSAYESAGAGFDAATAIATDELEALDAIDEARISLSAERDLVTTIGLLDAAPEVPYDEARAAFEAGELDTAAGLAATSVAMIVGASAIGGGRLLLGGGVALAVLLLLLAVAFLAWRRRRRLAPAAGTIEPYATLAADRDGGPGAPDGATPDTPAVAPLEGGDREGGTPSER